MTLLDAFANALLSADRMIQAARGPRRDSRGGWVMPINTQDRSIVLDPTNGIDQTVTYAGAVESNPVLWAVVTKLVRELSTLGLGVHKRAPATGRLTRVYDTDLELLLTRPAPGCGLVDLLQWLFMPLLVEGNGLIGKYRADLEQPTALLPLDWRFMSAFARPGMPVEYWMSSQLGFDQARVLAPSEVVHVAWTPPSAGSIGVSALRPLATSFRLDDAARRFQQAHLTNAARPSGALVFPATDEEPSDETKESIREAVRRMHGGVDNAFKVALMGGGVEWKPMSFSAAEAELGDTRVRSREEICVAYDVRWSQLADSNGGSSNVGELARDLHRTLRPIAALAESALQRQLIDDEPAWADENLVVRFDFAEVLRGSPQEEMNLAAHGFTNGVLSQDESRERVGLKPYGTEQSKVAHIPHAQLAPGNGDGRAQPPSTDPGSERNRLDRGPGTE